MNKRKMFIDAGLSIAASAIPIATLQLILLPLLGQQLPNENEYGLIITLIGVMSVATQTFGPLNNVRLLLNQEYADTKECGDFNILLVLFAFAGALCTVIGSAIFFTSLNVIHIMLLSMATALNVINGYLLVAFRLEINYVRIFIGNTALCVGYFIGYGLFLISGYWEWIYVIAPLFSILYVIKHSRLIAEPFRFTPLLKKTFRQSLVLILAGCLGSLLSYIDRLVLFPLIGGAALSVYYASTILGKAISMGITPIAGVMLSYFAGMKRISRRNITLAIGTAGVVGAVGYLVCIVISPMLLKMLYPQWAEEALKLIAITSLTAVVEMVCSVASPIILKFRDIRWQIAIYSFYLVVYVGISLCGLRFYDLIGFCVGALLSTFLKLIVMLAICYFPWITTR